MNDSKKQKLGKIAVGIVIGWMVVALTLGQ